jgi:hypothetical protein
MPDPYNLTDAEFVIALEHLGVINPGDPQPFEDGSNYGQLTATWTLEGVTPPPEEELNAAFDAANA